MIIIVEKGIWDFRCATYLSTKLFEKCCNSKRCESCFIGLAKKDVDYRRWKNFQDKPFRSEGYNGMIIPLFCEENA